MKNFIVAIVLAFSAMFAVVPANAEASFDQIQTLIQKQEYRAAEKGLEEIIHNHPNSAKAFYAMAQAQAGLGNLTKAQHALDKAMGLNPTLDFAPKSSVENLKQAIHPQVAKIEVIEESHFWRNFFVLLLIITGASTAFYFYNKNEKQKKRQKILEIFYEEIETARKKRYEESIERMKKFEKERLETRAKEKAEGVNVEKITKPEPAKDQKIYPGGSPNIPSPVPVSTPVHTNPVVVNNTSNNSATDFMLGAAMGHILTANSHKETVREREVIREVEKHQESPKSSSWDDTPTVSTRNSSWDDSSSSSRSSSWDDDSSSSRSSSWSSSSDSSSSSWDSGSSDSGSSSWD